ncbi:MAG: universal stress protein [Candidatus Acidiferrales bacterium]
MTIVQSSSRIALKSILFLTDFSEPSEAALPFAAAIARGYGAKVYALNVFMPAPYIYTTPELSAAAIEAEEENAKVEMRRVEASFAGLPHELIVERGIGVWHAVQQVMREHAIDLVVLGTHGRTGAEKLLLGSVAEEIFRLSPVPVLTIGPGVRNGAHSGGRFHRVLFATDFSADSVAAAPFAASLAQENHARLILLHVMRHPETRNREEENRFELSVAEAIHQLYEALPKDMELDYPPEVAVEYGEPAERILAASKDRRADLIVLGVRDAAGHIGAATHLERATAHKVVAHAQCPVLTVRQRTGRR